MRVLLSTLALAGLVGCGGDEPVATPTDTSSTSTPDTDGLVGAHDGAYRATMHRAGGQFALGIVEVTRNAARGTFLSGNGVTVTVEATVAADGTVSVTSIDNDGGLSISVEQAAITRGVLEATYRVGDELGVLVGTRDGALLEQAPTRAFDGLYEIALVRDGDEVAATTMDVRGGAFKTGITAEDGTPFSVGGFVTDDGSVVINETAGEAAIIMAEASIDQETFAVDGIYRAGDRVGRLMGRRAD